MRLVQSLWPWGLLSDMRQSQRTSTQLRPTSYLFVAQGQKSKKGEGKHFETCYVEEFVGEQAGVLSYVMYVNLVQAAQVQRATMMEANISHSALLLIPPSIDCKADLLWILTTPLGTWELLLKVPSLLHSASVFHQAHISLHTLCYHLHFYIE